MEKPMATQICDGVDRITWKLEKKGGFSVKSTYNALTSSDGGPNFQYIWKGKVPTKIPTKIKLFFG